MVDAPLSALKQGGPLRRPFFLPGGFMRKFLVLLFLVSTTVVGQGFTMSVKDCPTVGSTCDFAFDQPTLGTLAGALAYVQPTPVTPPGAKFLTPTSGGQIRMTTGQILTMGPSGELYRDAVRLPNLSAQKVAYFGTSILALGATDGMWWLYSGTTWVRAASFDASILQPQPPLTAAATNRTKALGLTPLPSTSLMLKK